MDLDPFYGRLYYTDKNTQTSTHTHTHLHQHLYTYTVINTQINLQQTMKYINDNNVAPYFHTYYKI